MYVVSPKESGKLLSEELIANHIYGPSYVSMESALRYYGMIPESVYTIQSITTKHSRAFKNSLGKFEYTRCSKEYFSIGIRQEVKDNTSFLIASPEKALCDLIIHTPNLNLRFQKDMLTYLEDNIRFDMEAFYRMDGSIFEQCAQAGKKKTTIMNILKIMKR
jgi:predicted transcriptional regulator of viral defense system